MRAEGRTVIERYADCRDPLYFAGDAALTLVALGKRVRGRAAIAALLREHFLEAFADPRETVRTVAFDAETGIGVVESLFHGRHAGPFAGSPATGRLIELPLAGIYEVRGGLIRAGRAYFDVATLLEQLGLLPPRARGLDPR